jgi:hypothetical protein
MLLTVMLGMATPPWPNMEPFWNHRIGLASLCQVPNDQAELRGLTLSRRASVSSSLWLDALLFLWLYRYLCRVPDGNNKYGFPVDLIKKSVRQNQQFAVR